MTGRRERTRGNILRAQDRCQATIDAKLRSLKMWSWVRSRAMPAVLRTAGLVLRPVLAPAIKIEVLNRIGFVAEDPAQNRPFLK